MARLTCVAIVCASVLGAWRDDVAGGWPFSHGAEGVAGDKPRERSTAGWTGRSFGPDGSGSFGRTSAAVDLKMRRAEDACARTWGDVGTADPGHGFKHKTGWRTRCALTNIEGLFDDVVGNLNGLVSSLGENRDRPASPLPALESLADVAEGRSLQLPRDVVRGYPAKDVGEWNGKAGHRALHAMFAGHDRRRFIDRELRRFASCAVVVATVSFGAQDTLHQPLNLRAESRRGGAVCFVAFVDKPTIDKFHLGACEGVWNVVDYGVAGFADSRMKARLVKALLPFHFPHADYSVWVDSKLQLNRDPLLLVGMHLYRGLSNRPVAGGDGGTGWDSIWGPSVVGRKRGSGGGGGVKGGGGAQKPAPQSFSIAVSENHVRDNVFDEGEKLAKMFYGHLHVNDTYDQRRERLLRGTVERYKAEGFHGGGLPDTGLFLRRHDAKAAAFSAIWAHELLASPFGRDQISYPYVSWVVTRRWPGGAAQDGSGLPGGGGGGGVNLFQKCWYILGVNEVGHFQRSGVVN